ISTRGRIAIWAPGPDKNPRAISKSRCAKGDRHLEDSEPVPFRGAEGGQAPRRLGASPLSGTDSKLSTMTCLIQRREARAMVNKKCWFWLCLFLPLVPGCLGSQARTYPISGRVTLDGVPLPEFEILFIAEDRSLGAEGGAFRDGKYAFRAR